MPKSFYYIMIGVGIAWWLILFFQNIVLPSSLYSFMWRKTWAIVLLYCLWFWFLAWFWVSGLLLSKKDEEYNDEHF